MNAVLLWLYRLGQVRQQLGFVAPLSTKDRAEVAHLLPSAALALFTSMSAADQQHSLRVCRGLQARGQHEQDLLVAALLHDVGKAAGRVPFWTRPVIVLGKRYTPQLLKHLAVYPARELPLSRWRRALSYAWWHAEFGADLAAEIGLNARTVHYIRMHHQPDSPELAELHLVDEAS
ncbi:MAG: hypothetical protein ACRDHZ_18925 [Ktedonobacteraceae bacterium]